jgi:hypothetical protein
MSRLPIRYLKVLVGELGLSITTAVINDMNNMKTLIILGVLSLLFTVAVFYGLNKTLDNRCNYYRGLTYYSDDKELVNLCH